MGMKLRTGLLISVAEDNLNNDGNEGSAPDPLVWSCGTLSERAGAGPSVRDLA